MKVISKLFSLLKHVNRWQFIIKIKYYSSVYWFVLLPESNIPLICSQRCLENYWNQVVEEVFLGPTNRVIYSLIWMNSSSFLSFLNSSRSLKSYSLSDSAKKSRFIISFCFMARSRSSLTFLFLVFSMRASFFRRMKNFVSSKLYIIGFFSLLNW